VKKTESIGTVTADAAVLAKSPSQWGRWLSFRNISAIYIFVVIFIIFAILVPRTFLASGTWANMFNAEVVTVLAAFAVLIPMNVGVFNLAVGAEIGFALCLNAVLQANAHLPWVVASLIALVAGAAIGAISGLFITRLKVDSFIATLGMSSLLLAGVWLLTNQKQVTGVDKSFHDLAGPSSGFPIGPSFQVTTPVIIMIVLSFVVWYVMERTPLGRRMYATGYNPDGARLSGVNVSRLQLLSLVFGGMVSALAGTLLASQINGGDPATGPNLLLPSLSAVFLGSTQFKGGRFNVWGTVLAVYVLATGVKGLQLVGAGGWVEDLFNGAALLGAVVLSRWEATSKRTGAIRRATTFGKEARAALAEKQAAADAAAPSSVSKPGA